MTGILKRFAQTGRTGKPCMLRNAWIEAIKESGNTIVVPDGSTPFVQVPTPTE